METSTGRRLPIGAEVRPEGGVEFRVWAPRRRRVEVVVRAEGEAGGARTVALARQGAGYYAGIDPRAGAGARDAVRLDGEARLLPDPASRFQPDGPHGDSQVIDPAAFEWTDGDWRGVAPEGQVIYEMHIGTFTRAGTRRPRFGPRPIAPAPMRPRPRMERKNDIHD